MITEPRRATESLLMKLMSNHYVSTLFAKPQWYLVAACDVAERIARLLLFFCKQSNKTWCVKNCASVCVESACSRRSAAVAAAASGAAAAKNGVEAVSVYNMATRLLSLLSHRHLTIPQNSALRKKRAL